MLIYVPINYSFSFRPMIPFSEHTTGYLYPCCGHLGYFQFFSNINDVDVDFFCIFKLSPYSHVQEFLYGMYLSKSVIVQSKGHVHLKLNK